MSTWAMRLETVGRVLRSGPLRYIFRYLYTFKWTSSGSTLFAGLVVCSMIAVSSLDVPVYQLLMPLFFLWVVASLAGLLLRPRLRIDVRIPSKATAGREISVPCIVTNASALPAWDVGVRFFDLPQGIVQQDEEVFVASLGREESATLTLRLKTLRRGFYRIPAPVTYTAFPFHLFRTRAKLESYPQAQTLLVLPDFHPVSGLQLEASMRYQPGGIALTSHVGESPEYIGNREYRPGDSIRRIDFRSWARLAQPAVREYQEEYYCRIALVLDTYVPQNVPEGIPGFPSLEAAVGLSASIADVLSRGEHIIDIFAAGAELHVFRTGRHRAHFENVLEILACIDATREDPFERLAPSLLDELDSVSTLICVFMDWDSSRRALVHAAREAGCGIRAYVVNDGSLSLPLREDLDREAAVHFKSSQILLGEFDLS